jgi:hypothetical protein
MSVIARCRLAGLILIGLPGMFVGFRTHAHPSDDVSFGTTLSAKLTVQEARQALIRMVEHLPPEEQQHFQLGALRAGQAIEILDERKELYFSGASWNCHLRKKTFIYLGPRRPHGCTRDDEGVFELVAGRWQARIEGRTWACGK